MKSLLIYLSAAALLLVSVTGCSSEKFLSDSATSIPARNDGAEILSIPVSGSLQNPAWSPSSGELLFTSFHNGYNREPADLNVFNTGSGDNRILVSDKSGNINLPGSAWNRLTDHIVYSSTRKPHDEIYTIYAFGRRNDGWRITYRNNLAAYEPSLSPDGEWIIFESHPLDVEGEGIITRYKIDGSQPCQALTPEGDDCRQPNWSPAGNLILYQKFTDGNWDIWTITPDGRNPRRITSGFGDKTDASFSPTVNGSSTVMMPTSSSSGQTVEPQQG